MIRIISCIAFISFLSLAQSSITLNTAVGKCLSNLATQELSGSYTYLQLSSKFGTASAYPGFSSLFTKLSDDDSSKAHDLVKFLALRKFKLDRLINTNGVRIRDEIGVITDIRQGLTQALKQNKEAWQIVIQCHKDAETANDANVQDYLESHVLDHHIEVDKLLSDFEHRLDGAQASEKKLMTFMLDDELLNTYGDRRKDIFS